MGAIKKLIDGHNRYHNEYYLKNRDELIQLAREGQAPKVAVVGCCDSRVNPAVITNCAPGDLFIIRNVANLVPPCHWDEAEHGTSAALQFAVTVLKVEHIIVLGHARCGGVRALVQADEHIVCSDDFITSWMRIADDARKRVLAREDLKTVDEQAQACEFEVVNISLENLMTFPWVKESVVAGQLKLHGWYYDIETDCLSGYDPDERCYKILQ